MRASPYNKKCEESKQTFLEEIQRLVSQEKNSLSSNVLKELSVNNLISEYMKEVREFTLKARIAFYLKNRVQDEKDWYANKSSYNSKYETILFYISILFQTFSLIYIVLMLIFTDLSLNATALFSSAATVVLSWSQIKRYSELSESYGLAARELANIYL